MKQISFGYNTILVCLLLVLASGGCVSVSNSPTPRFYALQTADANKVGEKYNVPSSVIIGIGPVKIPEMLNRPHIVTLDENDQIKFAQFDRWAEPLEFALPRLISADLSLVLPDATLVISPWNPSIPVKYQVIVEIVRLDARLDKELSLTARWSIIDLTDKEMIFTRRTDLSKPIDPHDYFGLVKTFSAECAALSAEIGKALAALTDRHKEN